MYFSFSEFQQVVMVMCCEAENIKREYKINVINVKCHKMAAQLTLIFSLKVRR